MQLRGTIAHHQPTKFIIQFNISKFQNINGILSFLQRTNWLHIRHTQQSDSAAVSK